MKHSEVLSRYVNTGQRIPEKQYNRLTPVLKKSYIRIRSVAGYYDWEFGILTDDEKIKSIEKKGENFTFTFNDTKNLLKYSTDKDLIATKIIELRGKELGRQDITYLLEYSKDKDLIITKIIETKSIIIILDDIVVHSLLKNSTDKDIVATKIIEIIGEKLTDQKISNLLLYSTDKDLIATKIIEVKGKELNSMDISFLIHYSNDKELIKKTLLQNGVDYKLINDTITRYRMKTQLIPDNYQSMLNEIRRIKEIMT